MTLTEFLLARITEDEVEAPFIHDGDKWSDGCACDFPTRWLAECAAKRRIVEWHQPDDVCDDACHTLRLLALPYADHPDYDESWRP